MNAAVLQAKIKSPPPPATAGAPIPGILSPGGRRGMPAASGSAEGDTARALVISVMKRIEGYLDEETAALDQALSFDFKSSNDRKSQGLLDLNQALRQLRKSDINGDLQVRLVTFREKLAVNLRKIRLHLEAVKEIAAMLSDAIQNAESDGTYTRNIGPYGKAR